jgi:Homing endonuclease associated repeat
MPRRKSRVHPALRAIDRDALEAFHAGIRKQYSDEEMLDQLRASAQRLAKSPTMREFAADADSTIHPQTVIARFGSWNRAKRMAGLAPRRFATRQELLDQLRSLGEEIGRVPTARDLDDHRGRMPSKSLYWHTFGSLATALQGAGFDVPVGEERVDRALDQGMGLARRLGRLPKFADWAQARKRDASLLSEWQVYRLFEGRRGAWATFQFLVRERLVEAGVEVAPDGRLS